jgi:hypothetical protein
MNKGAGLEFGVVVAVGILQVSHSRHPIVSPDQDRLT